MPSTKRKSAEDPNRKSTKKTPKQKSTEDSKNDKDTEYFEDYFSSQKADGPIFVSESDEREGTMFGEEVSGTKIGNQAEKPEVEATEPEVRPQVPGTESGQEPPMFPDRGLDEGPPSFHGFEGGQSTSAGVGLEEGFPVFQGFEGQAPGTNSGKEPPMFPDRSLDEGPPSFHGFEGEQSTSAGAELEEGFPVFHGFEGQALGTDSGKEPPMFTDRGLDEGPPSFHGFEKDHSTSVGVGLEEGFPVFQGFEGQAPGTNSGKEPPMFTDRGLDEGPPSFHGFEKDHSTSVGVGLEEGFPVFQGFEGQAPGTNSGKEPPMFTDHWLDEVLSSFHGFEGGQSTSAGAALEEDLPVFQVFEGQASGTDSGEEPPMFPEFDHEQFSGGNTGLDEKQGIEQERGGEEFQTDQGFEQVQGGTEESSHPVEGDGDSAMARVTTTSPGEEITAPGEETTAPGEETTAPAEVVMAPAYSLDLKHLLRLQKSTLILDYAFYNGALSMPTPDQNLDMYGGADSSANGDSTLQSLVVYKGVLMLADSQLPSLSDADPHTLFSHGHELSNDGLALDDLSYRRASVEVVSYQRSQKSIDELGMNELAQWKPGSSTIAVTTSKGYIVFYQIDFDKNSSKQTIFNKRENSLVCLRVELLVSQRIRWSDGLANRDLTIELASIPFSTDLQHSRSSQLSNPDICIKALKYSPLLGGFTAVLSNGKAAFITARSLKFEPNVVGVWSQEVSGATTMAVNHKYTLVAFGCTSGEGVVCHLDELTGALIVSHHLIISSKDYPVCGAVSQMKWMPDGTALAMSWERGGFSIWSVFGSQLLFSIGVDEGKNLSHCLSGRPMMKIKLMEWECEGYHLWMVSERLPFVSDAQPMQTANDAEDAAIANDNRPPAEEQQQQPITAKLLQLQFIKSSLAVNCCTRPASRKSTGCDHTTALKVLPKPDSRKSTGCDHATALKVLPKPDSGKSTGCDHTTALKVLPSAKSKARCRSPQTSQRTLRRSVQCQLRKKAKPKELWRKQDERDIDATKVSLRSLSFHPAASGSNSSDEELIRKWWKSGLIFKLSSRSGKRRMVDYLSEKKHFRRLSGEVPTFGFPGSMLNYCKTSGCSLPSFPDHANCNSNNNDDIHGNPYPDFSCRGDMPNHLRDTRPRFPNQQEPRIGFGTGMRLHIPMQPDVRRAICPTLLKCRTMKRTHDEMRSQTSQLIQDMEDLETNEPEVVERNRTPNKSSSGKRSAKRPKVEESIPASEEEPDKTQGWKCGHCYVDNQPNYLTCEACRRLRFHHDFQPPLSWEPVLSSMPLQRIPLPVIDAEYVRMANIVHHCHPDVTFSFSIKGITNHFFGKGKDERNMKLIQIESLQNLELYQSYMMRKSHVVLRNDKQIVNERELFHGTGMESAEQIMLYGFSRSFVGKNGSRFGSGCYFAKDMAYSADDRYAKRDSDGNQYILVADVLTGRFAAGSSSLKDPPTLPEGHGHFDSVVDVEDDPNVFVTFHDCQALPKYLITFRTE